MTLPDCVVLMVIGFWVGAATVVTIVTGFGAAGSMTLAPGGALGRKVVADFPAAAQAA